jgi:hypothetical protein
MEGGIKWEHSHQILCNYHLVQKCNGESAY